MSIDPRTPVLVGGGQFIQQPVDVSAALEPLAMMVEAVVTAAGDAACSPLLNHVDLVAVVRGAWSYRDPGRLVAERIGSPSARTAITPNGGNTPQSLLNRIANRITKGELGVAVLVGAEGIDSRRQAREAGIKLPVTRQEGDDPDEVIGQEVQMSSEHEMARGFQMPIHFYPTFESAIRHARGETIDEHRERISQLWARFNAVAVDNPYAPPRWRSLRSTLALSTLRAQS